MAKSKVTSKPKENQETTELDSCIFELLAAENLIKGWMKAEVEPELDVLLALIKVASAKLSYYQDKYHFYVDVSDHFFVEDMLRFAQKKAVADADHLEHLRKQGHDVDKLCLT